jgi:hypothetical protein
MMTATYTPLANVTLGSATSTLTFSSIPNTYRDLVIVASYAFPGAVGIEVYLRLNGDSGNGSLQGVAGSGTSTAAFTSLSVCLSRSFGGNTTRSTSVAHIFDYAQTNKQKTVLVRCDDPIAKTEALAQRWASTTAVTSFTITVPGSTFVAGSTFSLYGIVA